MDTTSHAHIATDTIRLNRAHAVYQERCACGATRIVAAVGGDSAAGKWRAPTCTEAGCSVRSGHVCSAPVRP